MTRVFRCDVASGAVMPNGLHRKDDGGIWEIKETPKQISLNHISGQKPNVTKIRIRKELYKMQDFMIDIGCYCFYPNRNGTPYYFTEINKA